MFVVFEMWITVEWETHFGRKYQGSWGAVFLSKPVVSIKALVWESFVFLFRLRCACIIISTVLRLRCAVIISSTVELEKHFGCKYQGCCGAVFLLKRRLAIITMNGVELEKHFCS